MHGPRNCVGVCLFTLRRELLLAKEALTACDLERCNVSLAYFDACDAWTDFVCDATEFVAEDVSFVELDDCSVEEV